MRKLRSALGAALVVGVLGTAATAAEPAVAVGEVSVPATSREVDAEALRSMASDALLGMDTSRLPRGAHAVLSVSLVRLDAQGTTPAEASCTVSATLRDRKRGTLFAIVEASARGQDAPARLPSLQRAIVRAALGSAVARVPEALAQHRRR